MKFGFEIREEEGRKGIEFCCYRNGQQCVTALGKPIAFKSHKAAEGYVSKQVAIREEDALISDEERAALKVETAKKEADEKAARDEAFDARLRREREEKAARENRARTNSVLRMRGYKWINVGFKSEEDADAFDPNLPVGDDWQLISPEGNVVSLKEALG